MWRRSRQSRWPAGDAGRARDAAGWPLVLQTLEAIAGSARGVVYDVPHSMRPWPESASRVFLRATPAWRNFLVARKRVDDGQLTLLLALRALDPEESRIALDWGCTYANSFLLVEPRAPGCDLTDPGNLWSVRVAEAALAGAAGDASLHSTPLAALFREVFGRWVYWNAPPPYGEVERVPLVLAAPGDTIAGRLLPELDRRFPQALFDAEVARLHFWERELFGGPVPRARSAFRTRLGMPILLDPQSVDRALRRLVNEGGLTVVAPSFPGHPAFGPGRPVPADIPDEVFSRFVMV